MKITVTFENLDEIKAYMGQDVAAGRKRKVAAETAQEPPKAREAEESAAQAPVPEPDINRVTGEPAVTEEDRVALRKELAALNKKVGRNIARELIAGFGVDKLTDVRLEDIPALRQKAREVAG